MMILLKMSLQYRCKFLANSNAKVVIHTLLLIFLFSDWFFSKYAECIENVHCTLRTAPRLHEVLLVRDRARVNVTSTGPFFSLGKVVNILHV